MWTAIFSVLFRYPSFLNGSCIRENHLQASLSLFFLSLTAFSASLSINHYIHYITDFSIFQLFSAEILRLQYFCVFENTCSKCVINSFFAYCGATIDVYTKIPLNGISHLSGIFYVSVVMCNWSVWTLLRLYIPCRSGLPDLFDLSVFHHFAEYRFYCRGADIR